MVYYCFYLRINTPQILLILLNPYAGNSMQNPLLMLLKNLNVIVIDNDKNFTKTYNNYFNLYSDYNLIGTYSSAKEALRSSTTAIPDIIITDIPEEELGGIDVLIKFKKKAINAKIIVISEQNDFNLIKKAFKNGANGYLTKPLTEERLYNALNSIRFDGAAISNDIAKQVISMFQRKSFNEFSKRENEIIDYLFEGETYKTIAEKLFVTASAVNFHIQNIYLKLNVNSKSEALDKLRQLDCA
ncbi:two component transcriptional regulator, LuxR family [Cellulophaga fucicola]|uniref:Two component transcriptional regulator, LuxR family n=2 Tax=Cellulophaga fucicola TaxID=76595 RepID=A0A1K1MPN6_9FLAO|nr:two component transcriptional regulator, LuxR family [Cellulophaga fucicola]